MEKLDQKFVNSVLDEGESTVRGKELIERAHACIIGLREKGPKISTAMHFATSIAVKKGKQASESLEVVEKFKEMKFAFGDSLPTEAVEIVLKKLALEYALRDATKFMQCVMASSNQDISLMLVPGNKQEGVQRRVISTVFVAMLKETCYSEQCIAIASKLKAQMQSVVSPELALELNHLNTILSMLKYNLAVDEEDGQDELLEWTEVEVATVYFKEHRSSSDISGLPSACRRRGEGCPVPARYRHRFGKSSGLAVA